MKTVIEMAKEAGLIAPNIQALTRFAALVREDEREKHDSIAKYALEAARRALKYLDAGRFTDASDYAADFWEAMENLADWEAGIGTDEREKQQEPVAYVTGTTDDGRLIVQPLNWTMVWPIGTNLYTTPPTAAIAAKQMRDAAARVCRGQLRNTSYLASNPPQSAAAWDAANLIAALPIPGEEK